MKKLLLITVIAAAAWLCLIGTSVKAEETVEELKEKIINIQNKGTLGFRNFHRCESVITYASYVPAEDNKVMEGTELLFYYEPKNIFTNRLKGSYQVWYTQDVIIKTMEGMELLNSPDLLNFNYQTLSPVLDLYATNSLNITGLPPGRYEFIAVLHDKLRKQSARKSYIFEVVPAPKPDEDTAAAEPAAGLPSGHLSAIMTSITPS